MPDTTCPIEMAIRAACTTFGLGGQVKDKDMFTVGYAATQVRGGVIKSALFYHSKDHPILSGLVKDKRNSPLWDFLEEHGIRTIYVCNAEWDYLSVILGT